MIDFVLRSLIELASLPGSVPKLRSFILDQAVRGNLTADWRREHPEVEPASVLLERIRQEKRELVKAGQIKKQKELPPVGEGEVPFAVPEGWEWVRLGDAHVIEMGTSPPGSTYNKSGKGDPLVNGPTEFEKDLYGYATTNTYTTAGRSYCEANDSLICVRGATTGRLNFASERFCIGRGVAAVRAFGQQHFTHHFLMTVRKHILESGRGVKFPAITKDQLFSWHFPLPPALEQTEIVRRVDELMALCDQLEADQNRRDATRRRALAAGTTQLTDDTTDQPFADMWPRFTARLPELIQHPDDIKPVQDAILQLAVRGRLTADWRATHPDTEPASTLIARIKQEKRAMVKAGKIKKQKELPPVDPGEVPFAVPESWEWVRLGDVVNVIRGVTFPSAAKTEPYANGAIPCLRTANVQSEIEWDDLMWIPREYITSPEKLVQEGDIIMSTANSRALVGKSAIARREPDVEISFGAFLTTVRPVQILPEFLHILLNAPTNRDFLTDTATQTTNIANISNQRLNHLPLAMCGIAEQTEIVRRVDELMAACTALAESTTAKTERADLLLERALVTK